MIKFNNNIVLAADRSFAIHFTRMPVIRSELHLRQSASPVAATFFDRNALYQKGYDLNVVKSVPELLQIAIEQHIAETHSDDELEKDAWGHSFNWAVIPVEDGISIFICSAGPPKVNEIRLPDKEPFAGIQ